MKHLQTITPIRTNRNKFNSSSPFRVVFSGTFNRNIYYDLSSAYLKIKIRCKPNQLKTVKKHEGSVSAVTTPAHIDNYNGNFYLPTLTQSPVDYIQGFFSVYDDEGKELKFELNNINNEEQANHCAMIEFLEKVPNEFEYNRHIRKLYNGMLGFVTRNNMIDFDEHYDNDCFCMKKSFDNKYKFVKGDDDYYYTTMFIPFTQILEPASRMSLLRIYAAEFDIIFKDCDKFWNPTLPKIEVKNNTESPPKKIAVTNDSRIYENYVTTESSDFLLGKYTYEKTPFDDNIPVLFYQGVEFFDEKPEIIDCDLYMDQYTIENVEEMSQIGNNYFQPCIYQLDNHVIELNETIDINKFKIEVPFKPAACYYYFTRDPDYNKGLRTDYLYLNPPKYCVLKTLTGQSTSYPYYENNHNNLIYDNLSVVTKNNVPSYASPDERFYSELLYNLKKFDHPIIDYESWKQIHRIYSIDMNSDLNLGSDKNTFFFEVSLDDCVEELKQNVRLHIIFIRDYN